MIQWWRKNNKEQAWMDNFQESFRVCVCVCISLSVDLPAHANRHAVSLGHIWRVGFSQPSVLNFIYSIIRTRHRKQTLFETLTSDTLHTGNNLECANYSSCDWIRPLHKHLLRVRWSNFVVVFWLLTPCFGGNHIGDLVGKKSNEIDEIKMPFLCTPQETGS